jgi:hypothetical protein
MLLVCSTPNQITATSVAASMLERAAEPTTLQEIHCHVDRIPDAIRGRNAPRAKGSAPPASVANLSIGSGLGLHLWGDWDGGP